ncbi:MAG: CBS domain-containing protein [Myxococcota bacterium]
METARDIMEPALVVDPSTDLATFARQLVGADAEGACVVDSDGRLVGIVTGMDLVFREQRVAIAPEASLIDLVLSFGSGAARTLEKLAAERVGDLMTTEVVWVEPGTPLDQVAAEMVQRRVSTVPVVHEGVPVGVITRRLMIATALRRLLA